MQWFKLIVFSNCQLFQGLEAHRKLKGTRKREWDHNGWWLGNHRLLISLKWGLLLSPVLTLTLREAIFEARDARLRSGAGIALLLLPLKSRSGTDPLQFLCRLGGREATNEGGSDEVREALREGGILLLPLKLHTHARTRTHKHKQHHHQHDHHQQHKHQQKQ